MGCLIGLAAGGSLGVVPEGASSGDIGLVMDATTGAAKGAVTGALLLP
jgi:hypothetical protein